MVTFVKPGVDVHRVVVGQKHEVKSTADPLNEMFFCKAAELFAECIPGAVIQAMAILNGEPTNIPVLSLASSILTAAFIAASITIEKDTNKH